MPSSGRWLRISFIVVLIALAVVVIVLVFRPLSETQPVNVSTILSDIKSDMAKSQKDTLDVSSDTITLTRGQEQNAPKEHANIHDSFTITKVPTHNAIHYPTTNLLIVH